MNPLKIFLLAALVLVVFGMDNAEAEFDWTLDIEYEASSIAISDKGD